MGSRGLKYRGSIWRVCLHQRFPLFHPPAAGKRGHPIRPKSRLGAGRQTSSQGRESGHVQEGHGGASCALYKLLARLSREALCEQDIADDGFS